MKVITVVNDTENFGFNILRLSCAIYNLELIVLVSKGVFVSNRIKDELLLDYLEEIDEDEIILFTDGNDALFMCGEPEILKKFKNLGSNLIFSAEMECWPDIELANKYPDVGTTPYKYLNCGGFIGKAGLIKELLNENLTDLENFKRSNQYLWTKRYLNNTDKITLDINCEIFFTFSPQVEIEYSSGNERKYLILMENWFESNFVINKNRILNKITNTYACHAHFNGKSKWLINESIINMVYNKIPSKNKVQFFYE